MGTIVAQAAPPGYAFRTNGTTTGAERVDAT